MKDQRYRTQGYKSYNNDRNFSRSFGDGLFNKKTGKKKKSSGYSRNAGYRGNSGYQRNYGNTPTYRQGDRIGFLYKYGRFLLFPAAYLFYELVLHLVADVSYFGMSLIYIFFFSLSAGFVASALTSISKRPKLNNILSIIFLVVPAIISVTEYLINASYQTFMNLTAIFSEAGDVAGNGFGDTLFSTIISGLGIIMVFAFPTILYIVLGRKYLDSEGGDLFTVVASVVACLILFGMGRLFVQLSSVDRAKYKAEYDFHSATCTFGLFTSVRLDAMYGIFGGGSSNFVVDPSDPSNPSDPGNNNSDSPSDPTDPPVEYGYNKLDIDFNALAESEKNKTIKKIHEYVASQTPAKQNEYTGLFEGKNLIYITAEAFSAEVIDPERTPTLYRLANKGIVFKDYYQPVWGGSTSTGEYSNLMGVVPTAGVDSMKKTIGHNLYFTMGNQLKRLGYNSFAYHNGNYNYYKRDKTHKNFGYDVWMGMGNGMEKGVKNRWPESDEEMMNFTVPQYIDKQPFSVYYMTVSGHGLYTRQGNSMATKNYSLFENMDASSYIKAYLSCQQELEYGMASLVKQLEDAGIADDTVIVLGTDHYPYCLEKSSSWNTDKNYLPELYGYDSEDDIDFFNMVHSALIIWSGCLEDREEPIVVSDPTYSLDILPTVSNLFGVEYDSRMFAGRDVFSDEEPLVIFGNYSWITTKGRYDAKSGKFTPNAGETVEEGYVERIKTKVRNKYNFSKNVLENNYWGKVVG